MQDQDQQEPRTTLIDRGGQEQRTTLLGRRSTRHAAQSVDVTKTRRRAFVETTPSTTAPSLYQPEMLLGRYRIMDSCGTGGFGTVLTCWDTRLQRRVAIKRMPLAMGQTPGATSSTVAEALAEARTSSLLAHPNIVTVFDFEADASYAYLVMEYVDGITLTELLNRVEGGTLTGDECCHLVRSVADALEYAHQNGVLHLDIKPSNIMIDHAGTVKLCDFGMATLASAAGYGDARGGTVGYMPPEQIEGQLVDERADVFSLGVVVWQALTGENPFAAPTAERSLALIERGPKTKISKMVPDTAGMAEQALLGALDPAVTTRTPSVAEFANELTFSLGDAAAGQISLHHLVAQTTPDEEGTDEWDGERLPVSFRYPWIAPALVRVVSAVTCGAMAYAALALVLDTRRALLAGTAACMAAAALWPPLGSALGIGAVVAAIALFGGEGTAAMLLPVLLGLVLVVWWVLAGVRSHHATPAVLLPCCLRNPIAGVAWASGFLDPLDALSCSLGGWAFAQVCLAARACGLDAGDTARQLLALASSAPTWIAAFGCAIAAVAGSLVTNRRSSAVRSVLGQVVSLVVLVGSQFVAARVENGGIWPAPTWDNAGIAVVLCVLVSMACILCGPMPSEREEDWDELY